MSGTKHLVITGKMSLMH